MMMMMLMMQRSSSGTTGMGMTMTMNRTLRMRMRSPSRTMSVAQRTPVRKHPQVTTAVAENTALASIAVPGAASAAAAAVTATRTTVPGSPLHRLWKAYTDALHRQPLFTKASMAACIFFFSDSATQYIQTTPKEAAVRVDEFEWDAVRALSGASFGVIATTWLHYWWGFLEVAVGSRLPVAQYKLANAITKVILDQGIGAPLYIYSYYCITNLAAAATCTSKSNSNSLSDLIQVGRELHNKASDMLLPTMWQHWKLWPAVHSLNFYFTPLPHRVLVQNTVLVGWSGYLSHLNHNDTFADGAHEATTTATTKSTKAKLMTPNEEINVALVRRDTQIRLQKQKQQQQQRQAAAAAAAAGSASE